MEYTYRFRIYPNEAQINKIQQTFGCCRYVYNYYLSLRNKEWEDSKRTMNYYDCSADLTKLKHTEECKWLNDVDSNALQTSIRDLDTAFKNFFRGIKKKQYVGYPIFKKKKAFPQSYRTCRTKDNIAKVGNKLKLPKVGLVKCKFSKEMKGNIVFATVIQNRVGQYYVSLYCKNVPQRTVLKTGNICGIDLGVKNLAILSDGKIINNIHSFNSSEEKLILLKRKLIGKTKGSRRYDEISNKIAKLHMHIANKRADYIHKNTTWIMTNYDTICIENLDVKGMLESKKYSKNIADASFAEFHRQLEYKSKYFGKKLIVIDRYYPSSRICSVCGYKNDKLKDTKIREWDCPSCRSHHDRDLNAAINILNRGLSIINE